MRKRVKYLMVKQIFGTIQAILGYPCMLYKILGALIITHDSKFVHLDIKSPVQASSVQLALRITVLTRMTSTILATFKMKTCTQVARAPNKAFVENARVENCHRILL